MISIRTMCLCRRVYTINEGDCITCSCGRVLHIERAWGGSWRPVADGEPRRDKSELSQPKALQIYQVGEEG